MTTTPRDATDSPLLSQASTTASGDDRWVDPELVRRARSAAAQGAVLLMNGGSLPLAPRARIALFGRVQKDWIAVGYGSGGDVNAPYSTELLTSLREAEGVEVDEELAGIYESWCAGHPAGAGAEWGSWPFSFPEMSLDDATVRAAAERTDVAVVTVGRAAGEDRENLLEKGSYYLTDDERALLAQVTAAFERTVVIVDTGNVIDLSWLEDYAIDALLLAWLGGMEGARAIADVLTGAVEPGGRLTDTIARRYSDYPSSSHVGDPVANDYAEDVFVGYRYFETFAPDAVQFPFGFGLGYTTFDITPGDVTVEGDLVRLLSRVTNTGERTGTEVVQAYVTKPDSGLAAPARELIGFARTRPIEPGASEDVTLEVPLAALASYDDAGVTGHRSAWVLVEGEYALHVGADVRRARQAGSHPVEQTRVVEQLEEAAAPRHGFDRMTLRRADDGSAQIAWEPAPEATVDLRERILDRLPVAVPGSVEADPADGSAPADVSFGGVAAGEATLDSFIAQLTPSELASLSYGDITMDSPLGAPGNAGALGGVTEALRSRGVPPAITTDGPSGIRVAAYASLLPCGTALASTWDPRAIEGMADLHAQEMRRKGSDILLSPGMNIHRDPLCGRNFEYFSEDPLLTGRSAAAVVRGLQGQGVSACPKHFACNNQETERTRADSRVSERALREIYLKGFEICVREASPLNIMTAYNKVNGVWAHYHYDLVTTILRGQWGYEGNVMTDWWMRMAPDPDFPDVRDSAYRVRAGVDVLMPGSIEHGGETREDSVLESYARPQGITLGEMQRTARHVLTYLLHADLADRASR